MSDQPHQTLETAASFEAITTELATAGWGIFPNALEDSLALALHERAKNLECWEAAGVGRHHGHQHNRFVRRDQITWINGSDPVEQAWLAWADALRVYLNRSLMLGLNYFESHFAYYPPGTFYRRHLDAFRGESNRTLSVVLYLNPDWRPGHGGELVLYDSNYQELGQFPPAFGTLAVYLSETFPHEVLPTTTERFSIAGWFRPRPAIPLETV